MVTIVSRDLDSKDIPRTISANLGAMHIEISTESARVCNGLGTTAHDASQYVHVIYDPFIRFTSIANGQLIENASTFIDDPRIYAMLSRETLSVRTCNLFLKVTCLPSITHHVTRTLGFNMHSNTSISYSPTMAINCKCPSDVLSTDGSMLLCLGTRTFTRMRAQYIAHAHIVTSHCIVSECARFMYEHIMATVNRDDDNQLVRKITVNGMMIWLIGANYYICMSPISNEEYDHYLAPRIRLRMSMRVTNDILYAHSDADTLRTEDQKRDSVSLLREMLNDDIPHSH